MKTPKMDIVNVALKDLIGAEYNPRKLSPEQYENLKSSLVRFGCVDPVIVNCNPDRSNIIIGGHQRVKVWGDLGNKEIPVHYINLDAAKEKELNVRLNKNSGEWDYEALNNFFEKDELISWDFDKSEFLDIDGTGSGDDDNNYTKKISPPIYEPHGVKPDLELLFDTKKRDELADKIIKSKLSEEEKRFLLEAAARHTIFNYEKIADYYAHSDKEMQGLMESSALIIIDFDKALENGYLQLSEAVADQYTEDNTE